MFSPGRTLGRFVVVEASAMVLPQSFEESLRFYVLTPWRWLTVAPSPTGVGHTERSQAIT
jgi:hypothetical protein